MTRVDEIIRTGLARIDTIKVRTALNPLLWLTGVTLPICLGMMTVVNEREIRLALIAVGALPVVAAIAASFVFLVRDPDRLQSEEYRIRRRALPILYRRGQSADIVEIANQRPSIEKTRATTRPGEDDTP